MFGIFHTFNVIVSQLIVRYGVILNQNELNIARRRNIGFNSFLTEQWEGSAAGTSTVSNQLVLAL